jgi:hypothetical protein
MACSILIVGQICRQVARTPTSRRIRGDNRRDGRIDPIEAVMTEPFNAILARHLPPPITLCGLLDLSRS